MFLQGPYLALINKILDFVPGINKVNVDAAELKSALVYLVKNSVMGFIVMGLIAFLGGYAIKDIPDNSYVSSYSNGAFPNGCQVILCRHLLRLLTLQEHL